MELKITKRKDYLYISVSAGKTLDNIREVAAQALQTAMKNKCRNLLVDGSRSKTVLDKLGFLGVHDLAMETKEMLLTSGIEKIAVVDKYAEDEEPTFFKDTLRNRFVDIMFFKSLKDAERWIVEGKLPDAHLV